jgi:hypothetical protein
LSLAENVLLHGSLAAVLLVAYLLPIMRFLSPRIWGFSDYPKAVTSRVPPQSKKERRIAVLISPPFFLLMVAFPLVSTLVLKASYGGTIPLVDAFLNAFGVLMMANLADLLLLDLLIVGTITPPWVIIPGTEDMKNTAYKDFRKIHAKSHIYGTVFLALLSLAIAAIAVFILRDSSVLSPPNRSIKNAPCLSYRGPSIVLLTSAPAHLITPRHAIARIRPN